MDGVALLSEVHPERDLLDYAKQAREWLGINAVENIGFASAMARCCDVMLDEWGKSLIVRSWDHVDFTPCSQNGHDPGMKSWIHAWTSGTFDSQRAAIVREPAAIWRSMCRYPSTRASMDAGLLTPENFARGYWAYARMAAEVGFVRYEDFCEDPVNAMWSLCHMLDVPFDPGFVDKWQAFDKVTGDIEAQKERTTIDRVTTREMDPHGEGAVLLRQARRMLGYGGDNWIC